MSQVEQVRILAGAEEFSVGDGPIGALLLHGFTSTPQNMRPLGDYLAARGIACTCPRFPGHGTSWQDLATRRADDWVEAATHGLQALAVERERVFVVGLSFGGAMALYLASHYPREVAGVVALAPYLFPKDPRRFFAPIVRRVLKAVPGVGNDIADPEMRELVYERVPTSAAHEMLRLLRRTRVGLRSVTAPTLLIHSRNDHTAHPGNSQLIHDAIGSEDKEIVWLERSYHVITLDVERETVFRRVYDFIKTRSDGAI